MRISRLFTPVTLSPGSAVELDAESGHYVRTVLRLKRDDKIILFNGFGGEYHCILSEVNRNPVTAKINSWSDRTVESNLNVTLGLSISRGDRMDLAVQKAVELGVNRINPLMTERCVVQLKGEKSQQRLQHWQKIMQHAAEQSARTLVPELMAIMPIQDWVNQQEGLKIFLDPFAETTLADLPANIQYLTLLIGPEGGFSGQERNIAKSAGFIPVRLGNRILRTETATIAALAAVQMLWGDFAFRGQRSENGTQ